MRVYKELIERQYEIKNSAIRLGITNEIRIRIFVGTVILAMPGFP